ncbi:MAG TPA: class I SAM-dependent methyltransferase [Methanomicrobia archaeon]|nr:class I SAM-dependent methyltransferase [Methanomicrobia archaeon]HEX59409.1 class I SAM-dependent methyltransferase [Methanomicrobia archaeon]
MPRSSRRREAAWRERVRAYEEVDRSAPDARERLNAKFQDVFELVLPELDEYERQLAEDVMRRLSGIQDVASFDAYCRSVIRRAEPIVLASPLQKAWRRLVNRHLRRPYFLLAARRAEDYLQLLKRHAAPSPEPKLDLGCADGQVTQVFDSVLSNFIGLDIEIPSFHAGSVQLVKGDACALPFRSNSLALITCINVIEHVRTPQMLLKECARCLKIGGLLFIIVPNHSLLRRSPHAAPTYILPSKMRDVLCRLLTNNSFEHHTALVSLEDLMEMATACGFEIVERGAFWSGNYLSGVPALIYKGARGIMKLLKLHEKLPPSHYLGLRLGGDG